MDPLSRKTGPHQSAAPDHPSSPISMLPTELLVKLVYWSLPREDEFYWHMNDNPAGYFSALYRCMGVSKRWENVIRNTEEFWAIADWRFPDTIWAAALAKSQVQPLVVLLSLQSPHPTKHKLDRSDFLAQTLRHIHRWGVAELCLEGVEDVALFNKLEPSTLRRLRIHFIDPYRGNASRPDLQISHLEMPSLQHLSLSLINLDPSRLSQLLSLTLLNVQLPSVEEFLSALRNSPGLYSLTLTECNFDDGAMSNIGEIPPVRLERLTQLRFHGLGFKASKILDVLCTPNGQAYRLSHYEGHPGAAQLVQSFIGGGERATLLQAFLFKHRRFEIYIEDGIEDEGVWAIRAGAERDDSDPQKYYRDCWAVYVFNLSAQQMFFRWIVPIIRSSSFDICVMLEARSEFGGLSGDEMLELFRNLSGLGILKLFDQDSRMDLILGGLSHPTLPDGRWLCPKLHTIHLKDCRYSRPSILLELVQRRTEAGGDGTGGLNHGWPIRLRCLEVSGSSPMNDPTWLQTTSILGNVAVWISTQTSEDDGIFSNDGKSEGIDGSHERAGMSVAVS